MGEPILQPTYYSVADYLALERTSEVKHEYIEGEIRAMAGGTPRHSRISTNTSRALGNKLATKKCTDYNSDLQIAVSYYKYVYADISVFCEPLTFYNNNINAANNPTLIIEVISDGTGDHDRKDKFMLYRQIPTLAEYVLIEQKYPLVEVYTKNNITNVWEYRAYETIEDTVKFFSIDVEVTMSDIYLKVIFDEIVDNEPPKDLIVG